MKLPLKNTLLAAGTALALAGITGCGHSGDTPNAAPYGAAAASPSPATTPAGPTAVTTLPVAAPPAAGSGAVSPPGDHGAPTTSAPALPPAGAAGPMMGMGGGSPTTPLTPTPELDTKVAMAEKAGSKPAIAAAYAERGTYRMNDANAGARTKYRAALDDYRQALKADPTNAEAKHNKDLIEGIYKQMGRPIPGA